MSAHHRNRPVIFKALFIAWLFCLGTNLKGQSPFPPASASVSTPQQQPSLRKFTFKHAKAADAFKILAQLSGDDNPYGIAVDERTNSLLFLADDENTREFEASYNLLDAETPVTPDPSVGLSASIPALAPKPQVFSFSIGFERGESIESLKQQYNELEQQTHQLANKLKQIRSRPPYESELSELQAAVRKSFEARQALQRAELADLAQRMKSMQQSIDMRDKLAEKVVQRRVEDLLNPNLKWDAGKVSEQLPAGPNQGSSNPAMPLPPSPVPSSVSVPYVPGEPPATVIRKKIQGRWIVQTYLDGNKYGLADLAGQKEVEIEGHSMRCLVGKQDITGPIFLADCKELESLRLREDGPLPIDFVYDPNGDPQTFHGIIACDGTTLSICMASDDGRANKDFRPSLFVPGTKVTLIKCRRAEPETANAVSIDKATWKSRVQQATSKLLAAFPVPPSMDQNDAPKVIAIVDVDYQGKQEVGNLKEEIYEWIAADIPFARVQGSYALLSRTAVKLAMQEIGIRPRDLTRSSPYYIDNRQKLLNQMRRDELKVDAILITSLKHLEDLGDANPSQFEITMEGFIDARTTNWLERVNIDGKTKGQSREPLSNSLPQFGTPQELLARVDENGKSGSYENFVTLFNDEGVRDLAGSLLMSSLQLTGSVDLAKNQGAEASSGTDSGVASVSEVFKRWLPQSANAEQVKAMGDGLSTMLNAIGGTSPDQSALQAYVISMRKSVEAIGDHRKFCVEMMQAYEKLTTKPFVYFGNYDQKQEWDVSQFGDRAIATLVDGSPQSMQITLQKVNGTWRISSLFNELGTGAEATPQAPNTTVPEQSNAKTITRRYSVGSFVTEGFFTGKGSYDTKEVYDKYETKIEQSLQDLAKTVTATCSQPPKFVQVLSNSRCLLIGHTEVGHQEIADFMRDIGINNDRIRLRVKGGDITSDEAKMLGIELTLAQRVLSPKEVDKLWQISSLDAAKRDFAEENDLMLNLVDMDETIASGTRSPFQEPRRIPLAIAARIVPGTKQIQIRFDMRGYASEKERFVMPRFHTLTDGQSVLFTMNSSCFWVVTADIVSDAIVGANQADKAVASSAPPSTPAMEMQQRLQGQWDVKIISFSAGDPKELVIRDDLLLLPGNLLGKPILISMKLEWPNPSQLDEVEIIWEPNDQQAGYVIHRLVGRIRCDGEKLQLCFVSGSGKVTRRPREMCGGDGIFYLECIRKRVSDSSRPLKDENAGANSLLGPTYSGRPISWWLDTYWKNVTADPKTSENEVEEMVAMGAIRKLRELPESNPVIEAVLAKWFASVEQEVNEFQLVRAAKCIVFAAGATHQKLAVEYLFKFSTRLPKLNLEILIELAGEETELYDLLKQLILNDELAIQFAERLKNGTSFDRSLVTHYLLMVGSMGLVNDKDPKVVELNAWYQKHNELFFNAFEAASKDENEEVRWFALGGLAGRDPQHVSILSTLTSAIESDSSNRVRSMAIDLLNDVKSVAKSQNIELAPLLIKTLESDSSIGVRNSALGALMQMDVASELVHNTLLKWAKSQDRVEVKYALTLMHRNQADGDRPQSIDELVELLTDPEWGTAVEVAEHNWSTLHRWARQYAIAILGRYAAHAHRALPTLEAELARNNKVTLSFAAKALDSVRGYCPDRPVDQLQGQWEFVSVNRPNSTTAFFDFPLHDGGVYPAMGRELRTASHQLPASIITVSGTQLKLGDRVFAEISHHRQSAGFVMLLDPDGKKRHCNGRYELKGSPSPEYKPNAAPAPELLILEVCELRNDSDTTQATKQTLEFRPVKK